MYLPIGSIRIHLYIYLSSYLSYPVYCSLPTLSILSIHWSIFLSTPYLSYPIKLYLSQSCLYIYLCPHEMYVSMGVLKYSNVWDHYTSLYMPHLPCSAQAIYASCIEVSGLDQNSEWRLCLWRRPSWEHAAPTRWYRSEFRLWSWSQQPMSLSLGPKWCVFEASHVSSCFVMSHHVSCCIPEPTAIAFGCFISSRWSLKDFTWDSSIRMSHNCARSTLAELTNLSKIQGRSHLTCWWYKH